MFSTDFKFQKSGSSLQVQILSILLFTIFTTFTYGQTGPLACNNSVQVSLDLDCEADITPGMILEGEDEDMLGDFTVQISGVVGTIVTEPGLYTVTVSYTNGGNSCWGYMTVEDKLAPRIEECACPPGNTDPDCSFLCTDLDGILDGSITTPAPVVVENCSGLESEYSDVVEEGQTCGQLIVTRSWLFTDDSGNTTTGCIQEFVLEPVALAHDVTPPLELVVVPCGTDVSMPGLVAYFTPIVGHTTAYTYAYPTVNGQPLSEAICNLLATKSDLTIPVCDQACSNSKKVVREWTVLDWCAGTTRKYTQIIKAVDQEPPVVVAEDITVSTDPWQCVGNFLLPAPTTLHDDCTDFVRYIVRGPAGVDIRFDQVSQLYLATGAPKGMHTFTYEAYDCCDNIGIDQIKVTVLDQTAPVAVSKEFIVVTLTTGGIGKIYAPSVDNGSHDGCTAVHLEVRRDTDNCSINGNATYNNDGHPQDHVNDLDDGRYVKFCCEDATTREVDINGDGILDEGYVKVWLRVWDDGDMDGVFGSANDNYNETWSYVKVDDKLPPEILCPPHITIQCDDDEDNLDLVGRATASGTCDGVPVDYTDSDDLNTCDIGTITRKWFVVGDPQVKCTQYIYKHVDEYFHGDLITWPATRTTDCLGLGDGNDKPTWTAPACALVGYSLESDTFTVEEGACLKILNKWTVVDWCQYNPNSYYNTGIWKYTQVIKVIDDEAPVLNCSNQMFPVNDNNDVDNDGNKCEIKNLMLTATADDNGDCSSKWLKWTVLVDLWGDGVYDYEFSANLSPFDNSFNDSNNNNIPDIYLAPTSSGEEVKITLPIDIPGSMSNHKIKWKVSDGCGNITECRHTFMVTDKKAPTPYCVGISSALMESGMVELWACDFDLGSFDNCTPREDLRYTFTSTKPQNDPNFDNVLNCSSRAFTCEDIADSSEVAVTVYVWDQKDNKDFCTVVLKLVDNQGACGDDDERGVVSGTLYDPEGTEVSGVEVSLDNAIADLSQKISTDESGGFIFQNVAMDLDYGLSGDHDVDYRQGVNTLDIVLIQRHILGLEAFTDVYQTIAADINNDEKISPADLLALRKLILGVTTTFPNQESYLILDAKHQYADLVDPWPLAMEVNIEEMSTDMMSQDLTIVKVGDINRDGYDSLNKSGEITTRSGITLTLEAEKTDTKTAFYVSNATNIAGMQMVFDLQGAQVKSISSSKMSLTDDMYTIYAGKLYLSWAGSQMAAMADGDELLTIETTSDVDITLATTSTMKNEAYIGNQLRTVNMDIVPRSKDVQVNYAYAIGQNEPNPFKQTTTFNYVIPADDNVNISVYSIGGKQYVDENVSGVKGMNTYTLDMQSAPTGVYYYTIRSGNYTASKKMILID